MITVLAYRKCSTCVKALKWLDASGVEYTERPMKEENPSYEELKKWKSESNGRTAILIDGARRVGKSYIAEKFARENYKSYILIDFYEAEETIKELFTSDMRDLDSFFSYLSAIFNTPLYPRESLIIFDEVQMVPKARGRLKYLVADGRYDYLETGSLMSIR